MTTFTLVRHSGYTIAGNPELEESVEVAELTGAQIYTVKQAGGRMFESRDAAHAAETAHNAPGQRAGSRGYFSSLRVAGAEIHVPK
jgi:hypothetical protein